MVRQGSAPHVPVLYHEVLSALQPASQGRYIDGTVGAGGHSRGILEQSAPHGEVLAIDRDPDALKLAKEALQPFGTRVHFFHGSYRDMKAFARAIGWEQVDGILLDLGVSSMQVDQAERGFSFLQSGPLDMRFDPQGGMTAADLVNSLPEQELADILFRFGEERRSRAIARAIIKRRPLATTDDLVAAVISVLGPARKGIHPATRTFQALRIAVNEELTSLEDVLQVGLSLLASGGRMAVISFHSLEDRIVKHFFRRESRDCICPPEQPVCTCDHVAQLEMVTRKPVTASREEIDRNPRSRSAKLRVAERLRVA